MSGINLPITRYYGSKRKLATKIWETLEKHIEFHSFLDLFGGTGSMSFYAKSKGKAVIYNDIFKFNHLIGKALIEQNTTDLTEKDVFDLLKRNPQMDYKTVIRDNFSGIYYTEEENEQIDIIVQNIAALENLNKQAGAYYLLFQSCLIKRPYNLFHRNNLNLRTNFNGGGFGNKVTWERSFEELFSKFYNELKSCTFDNDTLNKSLNFSALNCPESADLVYLDPPYFHPRNHVSYHNKYHFLEGLAHYSDIEANINHNSRNKEILINKTKEFELKSKFLEDLDAVFAIHKNSAIAVSYRSKGVPSIEQIAEVLSKYKKNVHSVSLMEYKYALNRNDKDNFEYLILGY